MLFCKLSGHVAGQSRRARATVIASRYRRYPWLLAGHGPLGNTAPHRLASNVAFEPGSSKRMFAISGAAAASRRQPDLPVDRRVRERLVSRRHPQITVARVLTKTRSCWILGEDAMPARRKHGV